MTAFDTSVVGFVGLGNMGSRMSKRLADDGHRVVGYDLRPVALDHIEFAEDIGTLAHEAEIALLSLPAGNIVSEACARIAATPDRRTRVIVDTSTIGPEAGRRISAALAASGITYVDAPVSGGVAGAEAGSLSMMVATDLETFELLDPLLAPIARHRFHVGTQPGQGQAMKLLNNFLSATAMLATSEAVAFGEAQGLDPKLIVEVLNVSSGRNSASLDKFPRAVLPGTYDYAFSTHLMTKDVRLYSENVAEVPEFHEVGTLISEIWRRFESVEPDSDMTYIYEWVKSGGRET